MKRLVPFPLLTLILLSVWLLLNQTLAFAHILLGLALGIAAPLFSRPLQPHGLPRLRRPMVLVKFVWKSLIEIIRSAFNVSHIILFARSDGVNSQFIHIPLDLQSVHGLAILSCVINSTPGTVWVELVPESHELVLHVFDLHDEQWWIDTIKNVYERPLIEVFDAPETGAA